MYICIYIYINMYLENHPIIPNLGNPNLGKYTLHGAHGLFCLPHEKQVETYNVEPPNYKLVYNPI